MGQLVAQQKAERRVLTRSRGLEYFSERELQTQIGFPRDGWPIALLKELFDNGLDACEREGAAPHIEVDYGPDFFSVRDNAGEGIPPGVVERVLDFSTRTSSNSCYVSPTRGQLGNALKCVAAAPSVLFPGDERATVTIEAAGVRHEVRFGVDAVAQEPVPHYRRSGGDVKKGTFVWVGWPGAASCLDDPPYPIFYNAERLARAFALFNPHASIVLNGEEVLPPHPFEQWGSKQKWNACDPTSTHWYSEQQFIELLAALLNEERKGVTGPRTLRQIVSTFDGLSGTAPSKAVLEEAGLAGATLAHMACPRGIDREKASRLLGAMKARAREAPESALGRIGKAIWAKNLSALCDVAEESVRHKSTCVAVGGRPYLVEAAFGVLNEDVDSDYFTEAQRFFAVNWSPALSSPFRFLDHKLIQEAMVEDGDPIVLAVHLVTPALAYTDRAKGQASLPEQAQQAVWGAVRAVTSGWLGAKKRTARAAAVEARELDKLRKQKPKGQMTAKKASYEVMAEAHRHVTGGVAGAPAHARQLMYAARKLALTKYPGLRWWKHSASFTQKALPNYLEGHPEETAGWNVVYDARGHLDEPHGGETVELGTQGVEEYVRSWQAPAYGPGAPSQVLPTPTLAEFCACRNGGVGPAARYRFVLLVEKQGFEDLIRHARLCERYDLALATTKGMSTTAARRLVSALSEAGVTVLVLHDFDKAGLTIAHTLKTDTRRFKFPSPPNGGGHRLEAGGRAGARAGWRAGRLQDEDRPAGAPGPDGGVAGRAGVPRSREGATEALAGPARRAERDVERPVPLVRGAEVQGERCHQGGPRRRTAGRGLPGDGQGGPRRGRRRGGAEEGDRRGGRAHHRHPARLARAGDPAIGAGPGSALARGPRPTGPSAALGRRGGGTGVLRAQAAPAFKVRCCPPRARGGVCGHRGRHRSGGAGPPPASCAAEPPPGPSA
jgi:DNA topoisomerase VI subunit B